MTPGGESGVTTWWSDSWNSTDDGRDRLHGRPYPSMYSWTHIGLAAVVVSTTQRAPATGGGGGEIKD